MKHAPYPLRLRPVNACADRLCDHQKHLTPKLVTRHVACHRALTVSQEIRSMQIFSTVRELRFGDCDISGTAYFPAYLSILNGVNEEFWAHLGYPWHDVIAKERWGTPTVHLSCDFSKPSFFGETLRPCAPRLTPATHFAWPTTRESRVTRKTSTFDFELSFDR